MSVATTIRRIRTDRGLTLEALAQRSGLSLASVQRIETGRQDPRAEALRKLASALEVPVADLFGEGDAA